MKLFQVLSLLIDRNYLAAKWYGFVDSQSGIDVYVIVLVQHMVQGILCHQQL
jgi:hypothetical protein